MSLQILLPVHTYPDGNSIAVARHAAAAARHLDADIHALILLPHFPPLSSAFGNLLLDVPSLLAGAVSKSRMHGALALEALEAEVGPLGNKLRISEASCGLGAFGDAVAGNGRYHDLVMVCLGASDVTQQASAEAAIFGSGRPTLLAPEDGPVSDFRHAMIAWDASPAAARAVADSLGFLRRAQSVTIVMVTDEKVIPDEAAGDRLAEYLSHHGILAEIATAESSGRPIADVLQDHAHAAGADLLVMGAFGHSRLRDFVLGGATRGVLRDLRLSVFLSH